MSLGMSNGTFIRSAWCASEPVRYSPADPRGRASGVVSKRQPCGLQSSSRPGGGEAGTGFCGEMLTGEEVDSWRGLRCPGADFCAP